jgi:hypothetical protein
MSRVRVLVRVVGGVNRDGMARCPTIVMLVNMDATGVRVAPAKRAR